MRLSICGVSHRTAPVEVRERLAVAESALPELLRDFQRREGLKESLILSTCNRVEFAMTLDSEQSASQHVAELLRSRLDVPWESVSRYFYDLEGADALRHLFRVASSLDSMVIGEPQILGQLKSAWMMARAAGAVDGMLDQVVTNAFRVAKRIRSETDIGENPVSVSYAAVELAREIFGDLNSVNVLLVGAGKMSLLAARHLKRNGAAKIFVCNRTRERAVELAAEVGGEVVEFDSWRSQVAGIDVIITSTAASGYLITRNDALQMRQGRRSRPLFFIDIAVPRNIEPAAHNLEHVFLYDVDDLQRVVENNLKGREQAATVAARIVEEEVTRVEQKLRQRSAAPIIVGLQTQLEKIRAGEVERYRSRLGQLTPEQEEALEAITRGIIGKVAHAPLTELRREAGSTNPGALAHAVRRLFRIPEED
jgi:glutamyl-tRNA reductase